VVSPRVAEALEGGVQGRARRGSPNLACAKVWVWSALPYACLPFLWFLMPEDEWDAFCLEKRLSEVAEPGVLGL
jgi:hypothetical protein